MNEQTIFTAVKILVKLLIIGTILMICLNMAWMARAEVATCPVTAQASAPTQGDVPSAVNDVIQAQNAQLDPPPMTVPVSDGVVTVEPQRIMHLPDGTLGLSHANVHTTLVMPVIPTPAPIIPKQDARAAFDVRGINDIEIKMIAPEMLDDNNLSAVTQIVRTGEQVAGQRFGLEQYQIGVTYQLERQKAWGAFLLWGVALISAVGLPVGAVVVKSFRKQRLELEERRVALEEKRFKLNVAMDAYINTSNVTK